MYFLSLVCTFHVTMEMYGAPQGADDFGMGVLTPTLHSPGAALVQPAA